jgi:hypothetical protein
MRFRDFVHLLRTRDVKSSSTAKPAAWVAGYGQ